MFKKAEKNELRTWLLGDIILLVVSAFVCFLFIGDMINNEEFNIGKTIFAVIFALIMVYCVIYLTRLLKAYKTYDERKKVEKEEQEKITREQEEARIAKLEQEKIELEQIKKAEEELRKANMAEIEAKKKEALENEKNTNTKH